MMENEGKEIVSVTEGRPPATVAVPASGGMDVESLMHIAIQREGAIDVIRELVQLRNDEMERQSKRDFHAAFAEFKRQCPPVPRDCRGKVLANQDGTQTQLWFAGLETVQRVCDPVLFPLGFSYSWTVPSASEKSLKVVCVLQHESGYSVSSEMIVPISPIPKSTGGQQYAGARTTGKRLTLSDVLGIATDDEAEAESEVEAPVTEKQAATIDEWLTSTDADRARFLRYFKINAVGEMPSSRYDEAIAMLQRKKGAS